MNPNKLNNYKNKENKQKTLFKYIKKMALKTRHLLKKFFPRRIKPTDQENHKGEKF